MTCHHLRPSIATVRSLQVLKRERRIENRSRLQIRHVAGPSRTRTEWNELWGESEDDEAADYYDECDEVEQRSRRVN